MTRPKVPPDKRQRTAIACDLCKRRKQKCNGEHPCSNCIRRNLTCSYGSSDIERGDSSANKRRMLGPSRVLNGLEDMQKRNPSGPVDANQIGSGDVRVRSRRGTTSMSGEEEVVYNSSRMLQDPTGRLLYLGDSATLAFLQLVRMIVESTEGATAFTADPRRHRIVENTLSLPPNARTTQLLPPKETALVLIHSFFDHTCGLISILNKSRFMCEVENCYSDPLSADPNWLCLLYLVFALGLTAATPLPGTNENLIIQKLRSEPLDRAEIFYSNAKSLSDPSTFEQPDLWSIQTLLIMALYMLGVSKRNKAYTLHGIAVRSAFAMGLHREESMVIFGPEEQTLRRNLWRSLYVLDRFFAVSLGRPTSISEDYCSESLLTDNVASEAASSIESQGLGTCIQSCRFIGLILRRVYAKRRISIKLAQELADECRNWSKDLDARLNWQQSSPVLLDQAVAILHVNLFYCHSLILLTRPFFISVLRNIEQDRVKGNLLNSRRSGSMERFSEACLVASCHSIVLAQRAMDTKALSRRNPFVTYFMFSAALIVLCNEYGKIHNLQPPISVKSCIVDVLNIMGFMAEVDPQAQRLHYVLKAFNDVVIARNQRMEMFPPLNPTIVTNVAAPPSSTKGPESKMPPTTMPTPESAISPLDTSRQLPSPQITAFNATVSYNNAEHRTSDSTTATTTPTLPISGETTPESLFDFQLLSFSSASTDQTKPDLNDPTEIDFEALWHWPRTLSQDGLEQMDAVIAGSTTAGVHEFKDPTAIPLYMTDFAGVGGGVGGFKDDWGFMV